MLTLQQEPCNGVRKTSRTGAANDPAVTAVVRQKGIGIASSFGARLDSWTSRLCYKQNKQTTVGKLDYYSILKFFVFMHAQYLNLYIQINHWAPLANSFSKDLDYCNMLKSLSLKTVVKLDYRSMLKSFVFHAYTIFESL